MQKKTADAVSIQIFMAGDIDDAKRVCRQECFRIGLCVTVTPTTYIYTGGEESGFVVGLINYPRFPSTREKLMETASFLAELLMTTCCQHSYTITDGITTTWVNRRDDNPAAK